MKSDGALNIFRWNIKMPSIVSGSIAILSDAGLGMAMFSLGTYLSYIYDLKQFNIFFGLKMHQTLILA